MNKTLAEILLKCSVVTHEKDKGFINDITEWESSLFPKDAENKDEDTVYTGYTEAQWQVVIDGKFDVYHPNHPTYHRLTNLDNLNSFSKKSIKIRREVGHRQPNFGKRPGHTGSLLFKSKSCPRFEHVSSVAGLNFDLQSNNPITEYILL